MSTLEKEFKTIVLETIQEEVFPECKKLKEIVKTLYLKIKTVQSENRYLTQRIETLDTELIEARASLVDVRRKLDESYSSSELTIPDLSTLQNINEFTADEPDFWDKLMGIENGKRNDDEPDDEPDDELVQKKAGNEPVQKKARYSRWEDRMRDLFALEKMIWIGDTIQITRGEVDKMFSSAQPGKSMFQFQRCYGKKGEIMRFDIAYTKDFVQLKHRSLNREQLEKLYCRNISP